MRRKCLGYINNVIVRLCYKCFSRWSMQLKGGLRLRQFVQSLINIKEHYMKTVIPQARYEKSKRKHSSWSSGLVKRGKETGRYDL